MFRLVGSTLWTNRARVLRQNGLAENKLMMGVTTAIGGEGGTPVAAEKIGEYFADLEKNGHQHQFRQLLQRDAGPGRGPWDAIASTERRKNSTE